MSRTDRPDNDRPDDLDAVFSEIVADLRAEGFGSSAEQTDPGENTGYRDDPSPESGVRGSPTTSDWRSGGVGWDSTMLSGDGADTDSDDDHFVPPEPPPLPKLTRAAIMVLAFFGVGLLLLVAPGVLGIGTNVATPLGILALATGLGFLLLRSREGPPPGADPDSGAQV
ncbi:MAG: hypothetical protein ACRDQ7_12275 [Haloechinothrix sp.]